MCMPLVKVWIVSGLMIVVSLAKHSFKNARPKTTCRRNVCPYSAMHISYIASSLSIFY